MTTLSWLVWLASCSGGDAKFDSAGAGGGDDDSGEAESGHADSGVPTDSDTGCVPSGEAWEDLDGDGYGARELTLEERCAGALGAVLDGDCDDGNPGVHPGAFDPCDELDQDCNGATAENCGIYDYCATVNSSDWMGYEVGALGDINSDGLRDFAVGGAWSGGTLGVVLGPFADAGAFDPAVLEGESGTLIRGVVGEFDWDGDGELDLLTGSNLPPSTGSVPVIAFGPLDVPRLVGPTADVFFESTTYWGGGGAVISGGDSPELVVHDTLDGEVTLDVYSGQDAGIHAVSERLVAIENEWNGSVDDGGDWYYFVRGFNAVENAGDLDGDGIDDLVAATLEYAIWADEWDSGEDADAALFVFAGPLSTHASTADADLAMPGAGRGFVAIGATADADGDGLAELPLIVDGDYHGNGAFSGLVRHPSPVLAGTTPSLFLEFETTHTRYLDAGGDLTGDGVADIIVGDDRGNVVAIDGRSEGVVDAVDAIWTLTELNHDVHFMPFTNVGDVDGDDIGDVILGFPLGMDGANTTCGFCVLRGSSLLSQ